MQYFGDGSVSVGYVSLTFYRLKGHAHDFGKKIISHILMFTML